MGGARAVCLDAAYRACRENYWGGMSARRAKCSLGLCDPDGDAVMNIFSPVRGVPSHSQICLDTGIGRDCFTKPWNVVQIHISASIEPHL